MVRIKRYLIPFIIIGLIWVSGCSGSARTRSIVDDSSTSTNDGILSLWMFDTSPYIKPTAEEVAKEMNIKLKYIFSNPEGYKTKIKVAVTANELPDVFSQYGGQAERELILNANVAAPLNDVLNYSGLGERFIAGSLIPDKDGNIYSLPYRTENSQVVLYNKRLMTHLGIQPPKTWDELLQVIQAANKKGVIPIALGGKDRWPGDLLYNTLVLREDPQAYAKAQQGIIPFTEQPFVDAADKVIRLVKEHAFQPYFLEQSDLEARDLFYSGKALMIINGSWLFYKSIASLGDDLGYIKFPQTGAAQDALSTNTGEHSDAPYGLYVNNQSPRLELAKEFAIRLSLRINDEIVKQGQPAYATTNVQAQGSLNKAYSQYQEDFNSYQFIQTYWFNTLPAAVGEEYRYLNQKLYTGTLSSSDYVQSLEKIMRKHQ